MHRNQIRQREIEEFVQLQKSATVNLIENYHNECGISSFILRFFIIHQCYPNVYYYADRKMPYMSIMNCTMKRELVVIYGAPTRTKEVEYIRGS